MAANFRVTRVRGKSALSLMLSGDFDGMSAMELVCALKDIPPDVKEVYINTDALNSISPFGQDVFQKNLTLSRFSSKKLFFMGDHCTQIAPGNN